MVAARLAEGIADWPYSWFWKLRGLLGDEPAESFRSGPGSPVLLLPGVYETWHFLRPAARRLHRLGHPIHVVPGFRRNTGSIPEMAALAERYLEQHDLRDVLLVAHSKGGLIGKHLMVVDDRAGRIRGMITINTPFAGSVYSRYAPSAALRAFIPTAPTLAMLQASVDANARIVSLSAQWDPLIPGGGQLPGATNVRLPMAGHFLPLVDSRVLACIERVAGVDWGSDHRRPQP
ncbi:esterase/lipase family protein [Galbitalea soli]|uniref:Alpha/beta hydrolase n=1 Tax=Galbitalea soli TaxID=1268042 RepID=A0A7C9PKS7_9MICO|nr:alpha/beta hydrolase [Galbitalea soli]NEM89806.1 alpha/beta hydrolase [Galbitalea soli]NYJ30510.1 pimeloyl-ACP methyl ester carboxylesterase [Galbitalea soli]